MLASVWRKAIEQLFAECHALFLKHFQRPRHRMDVVQDDHVGHEVVVFHDLSLLVANVFRNDSVVRSEEHTSELQSLMRISYAVFCLKKTITQNKRGHNKHSTL